MEVDIKSYFKDKEKLLIIYYCLHLEDSSFNKIFKTFYKSQTNNSNFVLETWFRSKQRIKTKSTLKLPLLF